MTSKINECFSKKLNIPQFNSKISSLEQSSLSMQDNLRLLTMLMNSPEIVSKIRGESNNHTI